MKLRFTKKLWTCSGRIACSVYIYLQAKEDFQLILLPLVVERKLSELKMSLQKFLCPRGGGSNELSDLQVALFRASTAHNGVKSRYDSVLTL